MSLLDHDRPLRSIDAPGTLDGGDVLVVGRTIWVGASDRTNAAGTEQLRALVAPYGYTVDSIPVSGCLHLKSAVTAVSPHTLLVNPAWVPADRFGALRMIEVDPGEPYGANAVAVGGRVIYPAACPATRGRLEQQGLTVTTVEMDELAKAEGAVTCCSLIFNM